MQRKYVALLIGRFQPFHIGHLKSLSEILENYNAKNIKIIVVRKENSKLDNDQYHLMLQWIIY
jgi:cytidyltransferase-like protein